MHTVSMDMMSSCSKLFSQTHLRNVQRNYTFTPSAKQISTQDEDAGAAGKGSASPAFSRGFPMQTTFSYRLPVGEIDIEGTVTLGEMPEDADGYICFKVEDIEVDGHSPPKTSADRICADAIMAWLKSKIEQDEAIGAEWDAYIDNPPVDNPNAGNGTLYLINGRAA